MSVDNWLLCNLIYSCACFLFNFALAGYFMIKSEKHEDKPVLSTFYVLLALVSALFGFLYQTDAKRVIDQPQQYIEQKGPKIIPYDAERIL